MPQELFMDHLVQETYKRTKRENRKVIQYKDLCKCDLFTLTLCINILANSQDYQRDRRARVLEWYTAWTYDH